MQIPPHEQPRRLLGRLPLSSLAVLVAFTLALTAAPLDASGAGRQDPASLSELQQARDALRSKKADQAGKVDALEASDAEAAGALSALTAQVQAQQDRVEEAERAVAQANAERTAAEAAQAQAQAELDQLTADIKASAVEAYLDIGSTEPVSVGTDDINDTFNKRVLMDLRTGQQDELVERYRAVQEDLEAQRAAAAAAEEQATAKQQEVEARKAELDASYAEQKKFADALDARLNQALAEAAALADMDSSLSKQIESKQAEIAKALEAKRQAEAARAAQSRSSARSAPAGGSGGGGASGGGASDGGGGGGGGASVSIVGSGEIVTVGGIRVHSSIASNVQALLSAAAADGINFTGGGYRDPAGQIAVRRNNCGSSDYAIYQMPASSCRPPTAIPGTSMHERGLAIDFAEAGSTLTRGSSGFAWLKAHAAGYGLYNLPSEPWHWSTNGN
jgi:peptidoglycan hydrolase CwlO-like protein